MLHLAYIFSRPVAGFLAAVAFYWSAFLYEDEKRRINNKLVDLWTRVDDLKKASLSAHAAFMKEISALAGRAFDQLLGDELLSARAVLVSVYWSVASFIIVLAAKLPCNLRVRLRNQTRFWL